ncbi:hypothetical protein CDO26_37210 (plasmid) [Sinorhizobium meliloti]|nr:hypothetical protein CDO26_37210 [Sinorhizobium meliloti]
MATGGFNKISVQQMLQFDGALVSAPTSVEGGVNYVVQADGPVAIRGREAVPLLTFECPAV